MATNYANTRRVQMGILIYIHSNTDLHGVINLTKKQ